MEFIGHRAEIKNAIKKLGIPDDEFEYAERKVLLSIKSEVLDILWK